MNKNLYLLQTDKPSRFYKINQKLVMNDVISFYGYGTYNQHLYITSEERIEKRDWSLEFGIGKIFKAGLSVGEVYKDLFKKIILTTDQELIDDGVQAIDEEFLQWFVKNPSCEEVEIEKGYRGYNLVNYKIIIPKEEQKQHLIDLMNRETLEEVAEALFSDSIIQKKIFIKGAKWQAQRMYSEEDMRKAFKIGHQVARQGSYNDITEQEDYDKWKELGYPIIFEQYKNK